MRRFTARISSFSTLVLLVAAQTVACDTTEPPVPTDMVVAPVDTLRSLGDTVTMTAVVRDQRQQPMASATVSNWDSSNPQVATVTSTGGVTAIANGETTITAHSGTLSAGTTIHVQQSVDTVAVTGPATFGSIGSSAQLSAAPRDAGGSAVSGKTVQWSTTNAIVASVGPSTGLVTAVAPGTAIIRATVDGEVGSLPVTVVQIPATIVVSAPTDTLRAIGAAAQFSAVVRDSGGSTIPALALSWSSSTGAVTLAANGIATASANGSAFVRAQAGTVIDSVPLVVRQRADATKWTLTVAHPLLLIGDTTDITLVARDSLGVVLSVSAGAVAFSATGSAGPSSGTFLPTVDNNGTYVARWAAGAIGSALSVNASHGGTSLSVSSSVRVLGFTKISTYGGHASETCGIVTTGDMYCWGSRAQGVRGTGVNVPNVTDPTPTVVAGGHQWADVDVGFVSVCGRTSGFRTYCWGESSAGALGDGGNGMIVNSPAPLLPDSSIEALDMGHQRGSCALTDGHRAVCWSGGTWGRNGNGADTTVLTPVAVGGGHVFAAIATAYSGTCAVTDAGAAYCWGIWSTLGIGNGPYPDTCLSACSKLPIAVSGGLTFKPIIARDGNDVCAVTTSDKLYCWGRFNYSPTEKAGAPVFTQLAIGLGDFCGISNGGIYCWGNNQSGRISQPPDVTVEVTNPVAVETSRVYTALTMGENQICAIASDGNAWCWGNNDKGQLGDRTTTARITPVRVRLFVP